MKKLISLFRFVLTLSFTLSFSSLFAANVINQSPYTESSTTRYSVEDIFNSEQSMDSNIDSNMDSNNEIYENTENKNFDIQALTDWVYYYQNRYPLKDTQTKLVNNTGDGFEPLYGVRNFRTVLNGVVYRGGTNNSYNKYGKRSNQNPLPKLGLNNLCKEGFNNAFYLYPTNYNEKDKTTSCENTKNKSANKLIYLSKSPFKSADAKTILSAVFDRLTNSENNQNTGPIYIHCWNGWHASGLMSALILRQFCGFSGDKAWNYWLANIDGHRVDSEPTIKKIIVDFKPYSEFQIPSELATTVCPR